MRLLDRTDGGRRLAEQLRLLQLRDPMVLALPRGGVPVAFEVAAALGAPLDVFVARKVGAPGQKEFGIGAIAEGDGVAANHDALRALGLSVRAFDALVADERRELERRVHRYRGNRSLPDLKGRDVVLVDDGLATGVTAEAALGALRLLQPRRLLLAVPVCAPETAARLAAVADDVVYVIAPARFYAVGEWYERFGQTTDDEVLALLERAAAPKSTREPLSTTSGQEARPPPSARPWSR
jgi:predicted phosphoribosyltransferase